eukprot:CAMPEP_0175806116 /NCGR_PEP_ID=MMETSP0107_2-20121207/1016_1 /TAXON_ID=195067 ORGANISM="Goniomonas pacifica, Strain CCMP1869" /NCGR_SAMPLE_ID=MMETSP0107_2 /ASSEMBLY_ACC=CAM_ASM_000203 /LENGTH=44 /DNA_ID= /DNA_START= /DNA_END= /DNA_ORIENTATION=
MNLAARTSRYLRLTHDPRCGVDEGSQAGGHLGPNLTQVRSDLGQ